MAGYHATRIDDVATCLGCTKGRIYQYCPTKADLFFDMQQQGMPDLIVRGDRFETLFLHLLLHGIKRHG